MNVGNNNGFRETQEKLIDAGLPTSIKNKEDDL
jgi:hypothetical protein